MDWRYHQALLAFADRDEHRRGAAVSYLLAGESTSRLPTPDCSMTVGMRTTASLTAGKQTSTGTRQIRAAVTSSRPDRFEGGPGLRRIIAGRGDLQLPADRLDPDLALLVMNRTIWSRGGRTPPRRKPTRFEGSRSPAATPCSPAPTGPTRPPCPSRKGHTLCDAGDAVGGQVRGLRAAELKAACADAARW